jgi:hypothetical protein
MDGLALARYLREHTPPVLVMTGDVNPANHTDLLRAGANYLVQEPIEERLLVAKLLFRLRVGRLMRQKMAAARIVETLIPEREGLVFMLWGSCAQAKGRIIDARKHCVLRAPHPSPWSAHRGFIGCGNFSAANRWLAGRRMWPAGIEFPADAVS